MMRALLLGVAIVGLAGCGRSISLSPGDGAPELPPAATSESQSEPPSLPAPTPLPPSILAPTAPPTCSAPEPCRSFVFDAAQDRCVEQPRPDGTHCASGCITDGVCQAGRCVGDAFEGTPCGAPSPCQPLGVCRSGVCSRPAGTPLQPDWEYPLGNLWPVGSEVVDANEHLFFVATEGLSAWAISLDVDGHERFRVEVPTAGAHPGRAYPLGISGEYFLVASWQAVSALRTSDGTTAWSTPWSALVPPEEVPIPAGGVRAPQLYLFEADDGAILLVWQSAQSAPGADAVWLARLQRSDGHVDFRVGLGRQLNESAPVMTEQGTLLVPLVANGAAQIVAFDQLGSGQWSSAPVPWQASLEAAVGGHAFVGTGTACSGQALAFSTSPGAMPWTLGSTAIGMRAVMTDSQLFRVEADTGGECGLSGQPVSLVGYDASDGSRQWGLQLTPSWTYPTSLPVIASDGSILLAANRGVSGIRLIDVSTGGELRFDCELGTQFHWGNNRGTNLLGDRIVLFTNDWVRGYPTGGRHVAAQGWVSAFGNPAGTHRPLGP